MKVPSSPVVPNRTVVGTRPRMTALVALASTVVIALIATLLGVSAQPASAQAPRVALVTRSVPAPGSDAEYIEHLRDGGWNVTLVEDDEIRDDGRRAVAGFDLVVISSSVVVSRIQWRLRSAPEPIIVAEHQLFKSFHFAPAAGATIGVTSASRKVAIVDPSSPLVAGLDDEPQVATKAKALNYAIVGGDAHIAAVAKDNADQAVLFSFDTGDRLASGERAAGPRVGIYMNQSLPGLSTSNGWLLFDAAVAWATGQDVPSNIPPALPPIAPATGTHFGANVANQSSSSRYAAVQELENQIGRQLSIINRFHEFSAGLTSSFYWDRLHIEDGRTVMVSWRATDNPASVNGQPDRNRASKIVQGQFDREIRAMANALRDLEAPVLLRFNWEMDQDPGTNQYIGTPAEFIQAWRYTHDIFQQVGAVNVEWVWSPRAASFNQNIGPRFYPGDAYVDWVGGSAVPIDSFRDPQAVYGAWNEWASGRANPKPQLLWVGLRENPNDATWKADFIEELNRLISGSWSNVGAFVYYHANSPLGYDYWVDTSTRSLNKFKAMGCRSHFETTFEC